MTPLGYENQCPEDLPPRDAVNPAYALQCAHCWPAATSQYDDLIPAMSIPRPAPFGTAAPTEEAPWLTPQPTWTPTNTNTPGPTPTNIPAHYTASWLPARGVNSPPASVVPPSLSCRVGSTYSPSIYTAVYGCYSWAYSAGLDWALQQPYYADEIRVRGGVNATAYGTLTLNADGWTQSKSINGTNTTIVFDVPNGWYSNLSVLLTSGVDLNWVSGIGLYVLAGPVPTGTPPPTWTPLPSPTPVNSPTPAPTLRVPGSWSGGGPVTWNNSCAEPESWAGIAPPIVTFPEELVATKFVCHEVIPVLGPWGPWDMDFFNVHIPQFYFEGIDICVVSIGWPDISIFGIGGLDVVLSFIGAMMIYRRFVGIRAVG